MTIDVDRERAASVIPRPTLYRETAGITRPLDRVNFAFHENRARDTAQHAIFESRRLYLPAGRYRISMGLEGEMSWRSFTVRPRTEQRKLLATLNGQRIGFAPGPACRFRWSSTSPSSTTRPAATLPRNPRSFSSPSIGGSRSVRPFGRVSDRATTAGCRIESPGHERQEFEMDVPRFESVVSIEARLAPARDGTAPSTERAGRNLSPDF